MLSSHRIRCCSEDKRSVYERSSDGYEGKREGEADEQEAVSKQLRAGVSVIYREDSKLNAKYP